MKEERVEGISLMFKKKLKKTTKIMQENVFFWRIIKYLKKGGD